MRNSSRRPYSPGVPGGTVVPATWSSHLILCLISFILTPTVRPAHIGALLGTTGIPGAFRVRRVERGVGRGRRADFPRESSGVR